MNANSEHMVVFQMIPYPCPVITCTKAVDFHLLSFPLCFSCVSCFPLTKLMAGASTTFILY